MEFDWDEANIAHIGRHNVSAFEVEELFTRKRTKSSAYREQNELRERTHGTSAAGRLLTVVFTMRGSKRRTVTAYDMSRKDRTTYAEDLTTEEV